jgi:UDP-galactopyranose mutase
MNVSEADDLAAVLRAGAGSRFDAVVVGAGFAGATIARELAERGGRRVLVIERRDHIGGNAYDTRNGAGILYHRYGPHIYHTSSKRVNDFLSRFTEWSGYQHRVLANVHGAYLPVPFNKRSIRDVFGEQRGGVMIDKLVAVYGEGARVPINELRQAHDPDLVELSSYVFENIFLHYTMKQWGCGPDDVDPSVTARVPVLVSEDDRYFQDTYQGMPVDGYASLFESMLDHPGITVALGTGAENVVGLLDEEGRDAVHDASAGDVRSVSLGGEPFSGDVVFTGSLDEFLACRFGPLPYRSLRFELETMDVEQFQPAATVNYTVDQDFTRITEWKQLTGQVVDGKTAITREYPLQYRQGTGQIPYYPIESPESRRLHERYATFLGSLDRFHLLGRLAEYRYYNMDAIVSRALELADEMLS